MKVGLLIHFNVVKLKDGIKRLAPLGARRPKWITVHVMVPCPGVQVCYIGKLAFAVYCVFKRLGDVQAGGPESAMCYCHQLAEYVEIWDDDAPSFEAGFTLVDSHADVELRCCDECGTHWQVDVGRGGLAIRVVDPAAWADFDDGPVRLRQMIDCHGGLDDRTCQWAGCHRQRLRGKVFCPHHTYPQFLNDVDV